MRKGVQRLEVCLHYLTRPGERLVWVLTASGFPADGRRIPMTQDTDGWWHASADIPLSQGATLSYGYALVCEGRCIRGEWRQHRLAFAAASPDTGVGILPESGNPAALYIRDRWQDAPVDAILYGEFFQQRIFGAASEDLPSRVQNGPICTADLLSDASRVQKSRFCTSDPATVSLPRVLFRADAPGLGADECLALIGSSDALGHWTKPIPMERRGAEWTLALPEAAPDKTAPSADGASTPEYKYVILDRATGVIKDWECGENHSAHFPGTSAIPAEADAVSGTAGVLLLQDAPRFDRPLWRGAGVAVPVFSLRSQEDFGVGEFADLKRLADWAAEAGMHVIQLLPVNDTSAGGTWRDSYPYSAVSAFALHPMYLRLEEVGIRPDAETERLRAELNTLPAVDYERVNRTKLALLRARYREVQGSEGIEVHRFAEENREWLHPYAVFCVLRDLHGSPDPANWGEDARWSQALEDRILNQKRSETGFYLWLQYHLDRQLRDAAEYARLRGVTLKGDLPIGVNRCSADAWTHPGLFNLDCCAGAPPDYFSADGQNWGFPTYNWEAMARDGYAWWKARMRRLSRYFDAFRIDHILGFFRIWEIPAGIRSGMAGHFNPALPYPAKELAEAGFSPREMPAAFCRASRIQEPQSPQEGPLFWEDMHRKGWWHPSIAATSTTAYARLTPGQKAHFDALYEDFFYHRHDAFWAEGARKKLPAVLESGMLACGEDLGMIPACVPELMRQLHILSLEIQRMPKAFGEGLGDPRRFPYESVCATGTHDTETLRQWLVQGGRGDSPETCLTRLQDNLRAGSVLAVFPLQDWLSVDGALRYAGNPADERINDPGNPNQYWHWRMHLTLEDLQGRNTFTRRLAALIRASGR